MQVDYSDQLGIFNPDGFAWPVNLIGIGGIGSAVVGPLAAMGVRNLILWDHDVNIEPHNIPAQLIYRRSDLGRSKIEATLDYLERQEEACNLTAHEVEVDDESTALGGVVLSAVDSMKSRRAIWKKVRYNSNVPLYMDARLGGEELQLLTCNPCDPVQIAQYEQELFTDEEGAPLACAQRTFIGPPLMLASFITTQLAKFSREEALCSNLRFNLGTMRFLVTR